MCYLNKVLANIFASHQFLIFLFKEMSYEDIDNECAEESVKIVSSENCTDETDKEINDLVDSSKVEENVVDIDDSESSNSNHSLNNTSVISSSENGKLENITPSAKKRTSTRSLKKKQESAKKQEEKERLKQVCYLQCIILLLFTIFI